VDFSTPVASPAQAGPQSPVSKTGIGPAARGGAASSAKAPADAGFASLVALAVDRNDGGSPSAGSSTVAKDGGEDVPAVGESHDESPLEATADPATLSLLIALAAPVADAAPAPQPEMVEQGASEVIAIDGGAAGTAVTAAGDLAAAPAPAATGTTTTFADALSAATPTPAAAEAAVDAPVAVSDVPTTQAPASASVPKPTAATLETPAIPADTLAPAAPAAEPATASPTAAAPAPSAASPSSGQKPAAHPLRQALAAIAATAPAATPSTEASQANTATVAPRPADTAAPTQAPAAASSSSHDARAVAMPRVDAAAAAPVAASGSASDAGFSGGESPAGAFEGFAAASARTAGRGAEVRLELGALSAAASGAQDMTAGASLSAIAGFGAAGETMLRAIDVPAAARFEQALTSVDPDVHNLQAMVRTVRLFAGGDGAHEARLQLEPEHLGPVALTVRVEQGSVSAHFRAETPAAQRWIETHQQELRAGLREQGLDVKEVVVTTDPDGRRERRQDAQPARPARARRAQTADAPRFEVLV